MTLEDDRNFEPDRKLTLSSRTGESVVEVEYFRRQHGRYVLKMKGIDSIEEAEKVIGAEIRIPRSELQPPKEGAFYTFQLKGCRVFEGEEYHRDRPPTCSISARPRSSKWSVTLGRRRQKRGNIDSVCAPRSYMKKIDLEQQRIDVDLPEGLRELNK